MNKEIVDKLTERPRKDQKSAENSHEDLPHNKYTPLAESPDGCEQQMHHVAIGIGEMIETIDKRKETGGDDDLESAYEGYQTQPIIAGECSHANV